MLEWGKERPRHKAPRKKTHGVPFSDPTFFFDGELLMKGYQSAVMSCTLSDTQLGTFPKEDVEANAALRSFFNALLISFPISLRMMRRSREKAEIPIGALVSWEESKL